LQIEIGDFFIGGASTGDFIVPQEFIFYFGDLLMEGLSG